MQIATFCNTFIKQPGVDCMVVDFIVVFADRSSPENNEIMLYDSVKMEPDVKPDVTETVDNPQYGDSMKQSDTTANPKPNENAYSYAIP